MASGALERIDRPPIALTAILIGAGPGLLVAHHVISSSAATYAAGSGVNLSVVVP
jgi:hypothetical protein